MCSEEESLKRLLKWLEDLESREQELTEEIDRYELLIHREDREQSGEDALEIEYQKAEISDAVLNDPQFKREFCESYRRFFSSIDRLNSRVERAERLATLVFTVLTTISFTIPGDFLLSVAVLCGFSLVKTTIDDYCVDYLSGK